MLKNNFAARLDALPQIEKFKKTLSGGKTILQGAWGSSSSLLAIYLQESRQSNLLLVVPDPEHADNVEDDLQSFAFTNYLQFPPWDILPADTDYPEQSILHERIDALRLLTDTKTSGKSIVIVPITALLQPTVAAKQLRQGELQVRKGQEIAPEAVCALLADAGMERVMAVCNPGEYSQRGGILDIYPQAGSTPYRIEFFADVVDAVYTFDPIANSVLDSVETAMLIDISPVTVKKAYQQAQPTTILDYLPSTTPTLIIEPERCSHLAEIYEDGCQNKNLSLCRFNSLSERLQSYPLILLPALRRNDWPEAWGRVKKPLLLEIDTESLSRLEGSVDHALTQIKKLAEAKVKLTIFCHNQAALNRFQDIIQEFDKHILKTMEICLGRLSKSFCWPALNWTALGSQEVFHRYRHRPRQRKYLAKAKPISDFSRLDTGDYVVHIQHGIAKYIGMQRLVQHGHESDYLTLLFAAEVQLYVPLSHIELVQKYIGGKDTRPELSKLGSKTWSRRKAKVENSIREVAADLLRMQAVRKNSPGIKHEADNEWQGKFEQEFMFTETDDQLQSLVEIKSDLEKPAPMDRLLCGDVGFGKTELAMRTAFKVVMGGHQVAVLVPTTILAEQHFRTFSERTADFPLRIGVLSRFRSNSQQKAIIQEAKAGKIDILIGTHRLLSRDVSFQNLGLVIIDEEQRFGVAHKERFKELRASVDVLAMTATPIPRTLHMGLIGLRDISSLTTPPVSRQAIRTQVLLYNDQVVRRAILRELSRGGQIYFVHNRVYNIEIIAARLAKLIPEASFQVAHGQMHESELEQVMLAFIDGKTDVLVATTIIESGLDIPNVNTIIINDADRFGLSDLHQLRGRVGRYRSRAYAYFLVSQSRQLTPIGQKRLQAIEEFSQLGAGFNLALRDLEIRGSGNVIGLEQSGHIHALGYELYCRLLQRVVMELQNQEVKELEPVELEIGSQAYLPENYINLDAERLRLYREISSCPNREALQLIAKDTERSFGKLPEPVSQLFANQKLRQRAGAVGINYLGFMERAICIGFVAEQVQTKTAQLRQVLPKDRKLGILEGTRFRLGLGYYEEEQQGYHMKLIEAALSALESCQDKS